MAEEYTVILFPEFEKLERTLGYCEEDEKSLNEPFVIVMLFSLLKLIILASTVLGVPNVTKPTLANIISVNEAKIVKYLLRNLINNFI